MGRSFLGITLVACFSGAALRPWPARACSGTCEHATVLPATEIVPANLPGFEFRSGYPSTPVAEIADLRERLWIFRLDGADEVPVDYTARRSPTNGAWLVVPDELEVDARYRLDVVQECPSWDPDAGAVSPWTSHHAFTIGAVMPLPDTLGETIVSSEAHGWLAVTDNRGGCSEPVWAHKVDLTASFPGAAAAWQHLSTGTWLEINGEPWTYQDSLNGLFQWPGEPDPFHEWAWTLCDPRIDDDVAVDIGGARYDFLPGGATLGLPAGPHEVRLAMGIPGQPEPVYGDPIDILLECDDTQQPETFATTDAGPPRARSTAGDDAGTTGPSAAAAAAGTSDSGSSGGCRAAPTRDSSHTWAVFTVVALALARRRTSRAG